MSPTLRIDPSAALPIWSQIEEAIRQHVARGVLAPGAVVASVRELARDLKVNPATVSRAYQALTDAGVLEVRRGDGTYVAEAPPSLPRASRARLLREAARRYAASVATLGAERGEAAEALDAAWAELPGGRKEER
jgi:GntR family transcriptional regulator